MKRYGKRKKTAKTGKRTDKRTNAKAKAKAKGKAKGKAKAKAKGKATPSVPVLKAPEPKLEVTPVPFGKADDPPYVVEVRPYVEVRRPEEDKVKAPEECEGAGGDDDVILVSTTHSEAAVFPHARQDCRKHLFAKSSEANPRFVCRKNNEHCEKCYCYVCDLPASECEHWSHNKDMEPAHCNAYNKSDYWDMYRLMRKNSLFSFLAKLRNDHPTTYRDFKIVRDRVDRAWRLYEAGEVEKGVLRHKFGHVTSWFQKFFHSTRIVKDEKEWIQKFVTLDALTEVMVTRSWRPPQNVSSDSVWDKEEAEKMYDRMMLSLGSRWLTCYAKCDLEQLPRLAEIIRNRMLKLSSQAKETYNFNRGFSVLRDLASTGVKGDETRVTKAVCNLYKSILRRIVHHVNLKPSELNARSKYTEVRLKDGIMLPFLAVLIDRNPCPDEKFVMHAKILRCQGDFYYNLTVEAWDQWTAVVTETKELLSSIRFLAKTVAAPYTYSTTAKGKREELEKYVRLLAHIIRETIWCDGLGDKGTFLCEVCKTLRDCFDKLSQLDWKKNKLKKEGTCNIVSVCVYNMLEVLNKVLDEWTARTQRTWWAAHVIQMRWRRRKREWGGLKIVLKVKRSLEMVLRSFYEFTYKARAIFSKLVFGRCKGVEEKGPLICIVALEEKGPFRGTFAKIKEEREEREKREAAKKPPAILKRDFPDEFKFDLKHFMPKRVCKDKFGGSVSVGDKRNRDSPEGVDPRKKSKPS